MVASSPASSENFGSQPHNCLASDVPASKRPTSLALGRIPADRLDLDRAAEPGGDPLDQLADGQVVAPADVDHAADGGVAGGDRHESARGVLDVSQVPPWLQAAKLHPGPCQCLADDRGDDGAGRLPRAERVERAEDRDRQLKRLVIAQSQRIGPDLGRRVGGLPLERVFLVNRHPERRPVDLGRGREDDPFEERAYAAGVEHMGGAHHVGLHHVERVLIRIGDGDQGTEVEDPFAVVDGAADGLRVLQVAAMDLDGGDRGRRKPVQVAAVVSPIVADEGADVVAVLHQAFDQVAADEPARTRDQDAFSHRSNPPRKPASMSTRSRLAPSSYDFSPPRQRESLPLTSLLRHAEILTSTPQTPLAA